MKIGVNMKHITQTVIETIDNFMSIINTMFQGAHEDIEKNSSDITSLNTRVTTLENSSSGGTARPVFYIHDDYLYKDSDLITKVTADEFTTTDATTIINILNLSDMENLGTYTPLFSKSTVDANGHNAIKVFIMLENGTLKGVYTAPYEEQSEIQ